ncbi:unnamed protein product [Oppiella nova]|uniref:C2H2-type domain-containing protein n=1 Tax=Oppiella nova TaxID=334625 RepID=A0A7R9QFY8_9ACAR|nr:unnamed protein product [Oppiella nova]CAG2164958.1 unnamed protein product [Oppiella nova]
MDNKETPRRRRAAALAAQKNWQRLEDEDIITDDDIIIIEPKGTSQTVNNGSVGTVRPVAQPVTKPVVVQTLQRITIPNTIIIDMNANNAIRAQKRKSTVDVDYSPAQDLMRGRDIRVNQFVINPLTFSGNKMVAKVVPQVVPQVVPKVLPKMGPKSVMIGRQPTALSRPNGQPMIRIETDQSNRVIVRQPIGSPYKKPVVTKLHPNEPIIYPTLEGEVEEIVGTYDVIEEDLINRTRDVRTGHLDMEVVCESDLVDNPLPEKDNDIEVVEEVMKESVAPKPPPKPLQPLNKLLNRIKPIDGHLELTLASDRSFLSYDEYKKAVLSTKDVKYLRESEVTEPIGVVTVVVSESERVITVPPPPPPPTVRAYTRQSNVQTSQSILHPIPAIPGRANPISVQNNTQRTQPLMQAMPTYQVRNQTPIQNTIPISIVPGTTPMGTTTPLILSPLGSNLMGSPILQNGIPIILSTSPNSQPTYLIPASTVYSSNQQMNYITTNANQSIQYQPRPRMGRPRLRAPAPMSMPTIPTPTGTRPTAFRSPLMGPRSARFRAPNTGFRTPNPGSIATAARMNSPYNFVPQTTGTIAVNTSLTKNQLLETLSVLKTSATKKINIRSVLAIKPLPNTWPSNIDELIASLVKLDNALMKEKFKESPIAWMVNSHLIVPPKCQTCQRGVCNQVNKTQNTRYEYWNCNNSKFDPNLVQRLVCDRQTTDILGPQTSNALRTKDSNLGSKAKEVGVASVRIADFMILGAMEAQSHRVKLCVVQVSDMNEMNGKPLIFHPIVKWLEKGVTVNTCESKFMALKEFGFKVVLQSKNTFLTPNKGANLTSIGVYLTHHLQRFFKDFDLASLSLGVLTNILDELLWRERYGNNPFTAFYNIIKHISEQCGLTKADTVVAPQVVVNIPSSARVRHKQHEYYYSSLRLKKKFEKTDSQEEELAKDSIQCHLCQMFFNNILIVKHLLDHLEKERGGRVRKGDNNETECKHCLRFFSNRTLHMHEELTNLKVIPYSCRICIVPFYARQPFIQHMKTSHYSGEMPYYCDICCYRSSFQKHLLDHFEEEHSNASQLMCPFCIRIFHLSKFKNLSQFVYRHLQSHYAVASVYDCDMTQELEFDITNFVVPDEEKQLCVRAREEELFTPFLPTVANNSDAPNAATTDDNEPNCELSCEPSIDDLLSIEPECFISFNEHSPPLDNITVPVDYDYNEQQLTQILSTSFQLKPVSEDVEEGIKTEILFNDKTVLCMECNTNVTISHYNSKIVCEKCNYTTHCTAAIDEHKTSAHSSTPPDTAPPDWNTVLKAFPNLISYDVRCGYCDCDFSTTDGNLMAIHMINSNHLISLCKPLHHNLNEPIEPMVEPEGEQPVEPMEAIEEKAT